MKRCDGQRVAVVYHCFAHYRAPVMRELAESPRHRYVFVADRKNVVSPGVRPWDIPPEIPFIAAPCRRLTRRLIWQSGLVRLALRGDLDTIIYLGNPYWPATWLSARLARLAGKQVLFWTIGWMGRDHGLKRLLRNVFYRIPHGLLLYGHMAKMIALEEGFDPERLYVVYNSLDYERQKRLRRQVHEDRLRQVRSELFEQPSRPMVICTSRLVHRRRLDLLLEALARLENKGHYANLLLVGDGPERARLEAQAQRLGLAVAFYGACYEEDVLAELIMAANVTVAPGLVGLAAMQSLAYGTPVITHGDPAHQAPESEAIMDGWTGRLFRRDDPESLAEAIGEWTQTEFSDPAVSARCRELLERFYNPRFQQIAIDRAVSGLPADDLFWLKENVAVDSTVQDNCSYRCSVR